MTSKSIRINIENPFSWKECLWFLDRGFDDCMYVVTNDKVYRAFHINGEQHLISISFSESSLFISWLVGEPNENSEIYVSQFITDWFDLYTDLAPFYDCLSDQKNLSYMVSAFSGLRLVGMPDLFESLIWGITGQQINLTFAYKIKRRLVERYGTFLDYENVRYFLFPTPEVLSNVSLPDLRDLQFSKNKAEAVINIANLFTNKTLSKAGLMTLSDFSSRQKALTAVKGIGIWTANYVLMKV
jgi:DNA-3-methyladenine glycosylase II